MTMEFIGKWSFAAPGGSCLLVVPSTNQLKFAAPAGDKNQNFNAYGAGDKFMLQAANGKYVAAGKEGYAADFKRDGDVSYFALEDMPDGCVRIVDLGIKGAGREQYYLSDRQGDVQRIKKTGTPPATAQFKKTIVTVGLAEFTRSGFSAPQPDLSWVYLAGADLSEVMLSQADLSHADLTQADLAGVPMQTANLTGANLSGANIADMADLTNADLTNANLAGAKMTDVVMNGAKLPGATLTGATLTGASLNNVDCGKAHLAKVDLTNALITEVNFTGADLTDAVFNEAVVRQIDISDADLTGAQLSNRDRTHPTIDLSAAKISAKTNFTRAKMQYVDLRKHDLQRVIMAHADLTGSRLDHTKLNNAELSYANLTQATLTGGVSMFAANLSNATLTGADLTGAQMGSISLLFRLAAGAQFDAFKKALATGDGKTVQSIFADNGITLAGSVIISASQYAAGRVWEVKTEQKTCTVRLETVKAAEFLDVYEPATAAILANAFMKGTILTSANLYNVRAPGVQLYGGARLDGQAILERAQFDNANMGSINLKQAKLYGVNLDYATLTGAQFQGAYLTLDAGGGQASLERANLQGADFSDAKLADAIFTDAAVAVARSESSSDVDGVWLFSAGSDEAVVKELKAGVRQFNLEIELAAELKPGPVAKSIRARFKQNGVELSQQALVTVQGEGIYWTVCDGKIDYVIFKSCNQEQYQPALGIGKGGDLTPQFTIPLYLEKDLQNGPVDPAVRDAFKQNEIELDSAARITVAQMATDWQIVDVGGSYTIWQGLDASCKLSIFARPSMPNLLELFSNHSVPLSRRTTVANSATDYWMIDNDSNNPFNQVINYIRFNLVRNQRDGTLDIYGAALRVRRLVAGGQLEYHNINCNVTQLAEKQLQSTTVCPNSLRVAANRNDNIPFKQWMRARELPKPPFCVPSEDDYFYCPSRDPRGSGSSDRGNDPQGS